MYEITIFNKAENFLLKQNKKTRLRILEAVYSLKLNPYPKGLTYILPKKDKLRVRIGKFRVLYSIKKREKIILIIKIDNRGQVYKN